MKRAYMERHEQRFNRAFAETYAHLNNPDGGIRKLSRIFLTLKARYRTQILGAQSSTSIDIQGFQADTIHNPLETLEALNRFISRIQDKDWGLGLAYIRYGHEYLGDPNNFVSYPCRKDDKGARPYFHRSIQELREQQPDAERLTIENAITAFEFYHERYKAAIETGDEHLFSPSELNPMMLCLVDALKFPPQP